MFYKKIMIYRLLDILIYPDKVFFAPTNVFVKLCKMYGLYPAIKKQLSTESI